MYNYSLNISFHFCTVTPKSDAKLEHTATTTPLFASHRKKKPKMELVLIHVPTAEENKMWSTSNCPTMALDAG